MSRLDTLGNDSSGAGRHSQIQRPREKPMESGRGHPKMVKPEPEPLFGGNEPANIQQTQKQQ
ncbi:MAG: hypothetical protein ABIJ10_04730 [Candidatus Micrarchaeota archaeon]|nr:hypothetical protein [Candidatus Micrarchaeota archaeon]